MNYYCIYNVFRCIEINNQVNHDVIMVYLLHTGPPIICITNPKLFRTIVSHITLMEEFSIGATAKFSSFVICTAQLPRKVSV